MYAVQVDTIDIVVYLNAEIYFNLYRILIIFKRYDGVCLENQKGYSFNEGISSIGPLDLNFVVYVDVNK